MVYQLFTDALTFFKSLPIGPLKDAGGSHANAFDSAC